MSSNHSNSFKKNCAYLVQLFKKKIPAIKDEKITLEISRASKYVGISDGEELINIFRDSSLHNWIKAASMTNEELESSIKTLSPNKQLADTAEKLQSEGHFTEKDVSNIILTLKAFIKLSIRFYSAEGYDKVITTDGKVAVELSELRSVWSITSY